VIARGQALRDALVVDHVGLTTCAKDLDRMSSHLILIPPNIRSGMTGVVCDRSGMTSGASTRRERSGTKPADGLATELVIVHVRGVILRGELRPGEQLPPERELARRIGVSRPSVRAGLRSLAAKGVLVTRRGAGTFVADGPPVLDSEPLSFLAALHGFTRHEMFEARRVLEVGVAGLAAEQSTGDTLVAISDEVTGMFASLDEPQAFLVHDIRFHRAVAAASSWWDPGPEPAPD